VRIFSGAFLLLALLCFSVFAIAAEVPSPALLVLNKGEANLAIVDPATLKVVAKVPTGNGPHEVATDGKLAFVANYGDQTPGNSLSVIDLATQRELRRVDLGSLRRPHGIIAHGGKVYFTVELNKLIARYDPQTDKVDWLMGTGQEITHMLVMNKDGSAIYTANILGDSVTALQQIPGPRGWQSTQIAVGKGPEGIDMSPDGAEVWVAHSKDGGISIIDTATKKVKDTLPMAMKHSNRVKFTPDGKQVFVSDAEGGEILVIDAATRKVVEHVKVGGVPLGIQMQPDGARAFVADAESGILVLDLKTLKVVGKIATGAAPDGMAWVSAR
jgi:YVTN family beta-propeller protein